MSAEEPPLPQPNVDLLEESRQYGFDGTNWQELSVDTNGQLQTALSDALQSEATDELRVRAFGLDAGGVLQAVNAEAFNTALAVTDVGLATYGDRALASLAQDQLRVDVIASLPAGTNSVGTVGIDDTSVTDFDTGAGTVNQRSVGLVTPDAGGPTAVGSAGVLDVEQQTPVGIEDSGGVQVDPATTALENALQVNATDEFRVRTFDSAGGAQDLQQTDSAFHNATAVAAGATNSTGLSAAGASKLRGRVVNDAQYDVDIEVLDAPGGTVLFTVNVATNVAASTETALDELLESPFINVVVTNDGTVQSALTASYHLVGGN